MALYRIRETKGPRGGRTEVQAVRLDATMYNLDDVVEWVRHYKGKDPLFIVRSLEPAAKRRRVVRPKKGKKKAKKRAKKRRVANPLRRWA